jgi:hypothetical protein
VRNDYQNTRAVVVEMNAVSGTKRMGGSAKTLEHPKKAARRPLVI